ncbi:Putative multidrug export ATP-binding/permease protein [Methylacidimicrobium cyclopophantes]|uniref:Multidrug export ATP-binding/permease protein n=1 Tax=Methylacidimicrobium cyclopophantes TaxID=1041766 RepID=A0A5E6M9V8_9BACT|nr:ABC transporter ATP-binding protein [Methylacidimicrobium cyclopophantes]VVM05749.1 Putative multidrug export ATP-binding/permease protein [Methylacidimicrobium cyclopophantes]
MSRKAKIGDAAANRRTRLGDPLGTRNSPWTVYRDALRFFSEVSGAALFASLLLLLTVAASLLRPWPVQWLIDNVLLSPHAPLRFLGKPLSLSEAAFGAASALVGFSLLHGGLNLWANSLLYRIGLRALVSLRTELFDCLQNLPLSYHRGHLTADSSYRVAYDAQAIQTVLQKGLGSVLGSSATLIGAAVVLFRMNPLLAACSLGILPFLWIVIIHFAGRIRKESGEVQEKESLLLAQVSEGLSNVQLLQAYGREEESLSSFRRHAEKSGQANLRFLWTNSLSALAATAITALGSALVLFVGAQQAAVGRLTVGELWIFLSYLALLYHPLEQLSYTAWALEDAAARLGRVFEVLRVADAIPDPPGAKLFPRTRGEISFDHVSFFYDARRPILRNLSLHVAPGQRIAIVGPTGSGKSTFLSLLPRFFEPSDGAIRIDGIDIRTVTKRSLREQMAIVLQDTMIFQGTVLENIALGRASASFPEIEKAAQAARADEFIERLPQKYETRIGEHGLTLSGGQRQRIGIARAFLRQAPILLLDEPTGSLDPAVEADIIQSLRLLFSRRTTLLVTHRLHLACEMDWIYVLNEGRFAESGRHRDLLAQHGLYRRLWEAQNSGGT